MANETTITLKWRLSDIRSNYPELTTAQTKEVLNDLRTGRDWLIQEGWHFIDDIVSGMRTHQ